MSKNVVCYFIGGTKDLTKQVIRNPSPQIEIDTRQIVTVGDRKKYNSLENAFIIKEVYHRIVLRHNYQVFELVEPPLVK